MAFNIIAESSKSLDFSKIHRTCVKDDMGIEMFPMPKLGVDNGDAVGICVPFKNASEKTWLELKRVLKVLKSEFQCDIYDLYSGEKLGLFNMNSFRKSLLTK